MGIYPDIPDFFWDVAKYNGWWMMINVGKNENKTTSIWEGFMPAYTTIKKWWWLGDAYCNGIVVTIVLPI